MLQNVSRFNCLGYLELIQNHLTPKGLLWISSVLRDLFSTEQLFYSQSFILCLGFSRLCAFFRNFRLVKGYAAAFMSNFICRKSYFVS